MANSNIHIKFEIEPIVKLQCETKDCENKLCHGDWRNFKYIAISSGKCLMYEKKRKRRDPNK